MLSKKRKEIENDISEKLLKLTKGGDITWHKGNRFTNISFKTEFKRYVLEIRRDGRSYNLEGRKSKHLEFSISSYKIKNLVSYLKGRKAGKIRVENDSELVNSFIESMKEELEE